MLFIRRLASLVVSLAVVGCAAEPSQSPGAARGMSIPLKQAPSEPGFQGHVVGGAPLPIFLNRNGGTYQAGQDNSSQNYSSVVQSGSATLRAYAGTEAQWQQIMTCMQDEFARFNVTVTDVEPTGGVQFVEAVIGDEPGSVDLPQGVGGVAPIDTFTCSIIPRAVVYTFAEVVGNDPTIVCEITAQEVAHAFSLDHAYLASDPMTYLNYSGHKVFQDQSASCGEYSPRACACGGATQNSVQIMIDKLGASGGTPVEPVDDPVPPTVSVTSPANNANLPESSTIQIVAQVADDVNVASAELIWSFSGSVFGCPYSGGGVTCSRSGSTYTWSLAVGSGQRTFQVRGTDAGGNVVTSSPRTITLSADGTTPPVDTSDNTPPVISILAPAANASLVGNGTLSISATATDDQDLGSVELMWTYANASFGCPLSQTNISCVVDGDTFTWTLNVSTGTRAFQIRAIDVASNQTVTAERTVSLTTDTTIEPPPAPDDDASEDNDTVTDAAPAACGSAIDLVAVGGDADWFTVDVVEGAKVRATVTSDSTVPLALSLHGVAGPSAQLAAVNDGVANGTLEATADGTAVAIQVVAQSGSAPAVYRLAITCDDTVVDPTEPPTVPGTEDGAEPNDDADAAVQMFCGEESAYFAADPDFFFVTVRDNDSLIADVVADGDVVVELHTADGVMIPGATRTGSHVTVRADGLGAGDIVIRVVAAESPAGYTLHTECEEGTALPATAAACAGAGVPGTSALPGAFVLAAGLVAVRRRRRL